MQDRKERKNNLKVLGLEEDADKEEIKRAYRKLAKKYHPDLNPGKLDAKEDFIKLQNAYDHLKIPSAIPVKKTTRTQKSSSGFESIFRSIERMRDLFFLPFESYFKESDTTNFFEEPEPFVDLRKIIQERQKRKFF